MADLTVTAASVVAGPNAIIREGVAGVAITAGQAVYKNDQNNNRLALADCVASPQTANCVGVALHGASAGQPLKYVESDDDFTPGATLVLGTPYVLSEAGGIAPVGDLAAEDYLTFMLVPKTTTRCKLRPVVSGAAVPQA